MADSNSVGGVQAAGRRYDGQRQAPHERGAAPGASAEAAHQESAPSADQALLSTPRRAAFPLLRERVLAATRALLDGTAPQAPVVHDEAPESPSRAAALIQNLQRRLAGVRAGEVQPQLRTAFQAGLSEAIALLRDVGHEPQVEAWFAAVAEAAGLAHD